MTTTVPAVGGHATFIIRAATPADAPVLAHLRSEFRAALEPAAEPASSFLPRCTEWMAHRLGSGGGWRCWVAEAATGNRLRRYRPAERGNTRGDATIV